MTKRAIKRRLTRATECECCLMDAEGNGKLCELCERHNAELLEYNARLLENLQKLSEPPDPTEGPSGARIVGAHLCPADSSPWLTLELWAKRPGEEWALYTTPIDLDTMTKIVYEAGVRAGRGPSKRQIYKALQQREANEQ